MRFYMGKRVGKRGSFGVSMDAGKVFKVIGYIMFSPLILTYYVCVWPFIQLAKALKKKKAAAPVRATAQRAAAVVDYARPLRFQAMTWGQYEQALMTVCTRTPGFQLSDADFVEKYKSDRKVWQFKFKEAAAQLVPEPTNTADPNAVMVLIDGRHVGYVPRDLTAEVRARIARPHEISVRVSGGPWKRNVDGLVEVGRSDFTVTVEITDAP